ncbi:MAG: bacillithiol biosynthesis cysteine-adding enzyme BshC [Crocinitomicaceae bacterium]|nr:bacillithiol biosynthesis cysteine-adding enzyme BshC [Crocinitomicaceae bacterium]MDG1776953.1 bacillithiol biosynthesis cysteine-adding enzyme BshC [Crocinitomicaceae bacterium]
MQVFNFNRSDLNLFSAQHINLVYNQAFYKAYIHREFSISNFVSQENEKELNYLESKRKVLVSTLEKQYSTLNDKVKSAENIERLKLNNTFTVTTGHQLSLFTGPLYFILKIIHVIKLAERLNSENSDRYIVPVFWMATEDHDFQEIQSVNLYGKEIKWDSSQKGPVGKFDLNEFEDVKSQVVAFFGNHVDAEIHQLMEAYDGDNLAEATFKFVHELFKDYGLVIVDGDQCDLKRLFIPTIEKELKEQFSYKAVSTTNQTLENDGGKIQVLAREINLFYIEKGVRQRIEKTDVGFEIEGVGSYSESELLEKVQLNPECFSPNVVLRPLYQETILPNLAYVGGGGEISYWLQLKRVFDAVNVVYPMICIRNSMMWVEKSVAKKINKIELSLEDLFKGVDVLKREFIENHSGKALNFKEIDEVTTRLSKQIEDSILLTEPNMQGYATAEKVKLNKQIEGVKSKLIKLSKANHEQSMKFIEQIRERLFPDGGLQERSSNILSFCPDGNVSKRIKMLYEVVDPEQKDFLVVREN